MLSANKVEKRSRSAGDTAAGPAELISRRSSSISFQSSVVIRRVLCRALPSYHMEKMTANCLATYCSSRSSRVMPSISFRVKTMEMG